MLKLPQKSRLLPKHNLKKLYKPGLYSDFWYEANGKPVAMAFPESLSINISELKFSYGEFDYKLLKHIPGYKNGGYNREITANVEREIKGNIIQYKINKVALGIRDHIDLEFK